MDLSKISVRYAKALFMVATERKLLDEVYADMNFLGKTARKLPEFRDFLENPVLSLSGKKKVIHELFKKDFSSLTIEFLDLIINNNRLSSMEGISRQFGEQFRKNKGITSAILITAKEPEETVRTKIRELLQDKMKTKIQMESKHDNEILGGFILSVENRQIDASVKTQLNKIRKELTN